MAQGDVIASITDTAAAAYLVVQPGAGVHLLVKDFFASGSGTAATGTFQYYDGIDIGSSLVSGVGHAVDFASYRCYYPANELNIVLNNALYCRVYNGDTVAARKIGITAIQIK